VLAAATADVLPHPVVNVGSGHGVACRTLVGELLAISGYQVAVHEDAPGSARSAALPWMEADITRARQDLAWQPSRDLKASVSDLWEGEL
jgi:UDP-glucose 4-epimerase